MKWFQASKTRNSENAHGEMANKTCLFCFAFGLYFFFSRILLTKLENDGLPFQGREESVFEDQELEELDK